MLGNIKIISHHQNQRLLPYKTTEQFPSGLGRFLECRKWYILVITLALGICLIYHTWKNFGVGKIGKFDEQTSFCQFFTLQIFPFVISCSNTCSSFANILPLQNFPAYGICPHPWAWAYISGKFFVPML